MLLVRPKLCTRELRNQLELPSEGPHHPVSLPRGRRMHKVEAFIPLGHDEAEFLEALSRFAVKHHAHHYFAYAPKQQRRCGKEVPKHSPDAKQRVDQHRKHTAGERCSDLRLVVYRLRLPIA